MLFLEDCIVFCGNTLAKSVFFNLFIVSKSPAEFSTPFGTFMGMRSHTNLHCLVNLAITVPFRTTGCSSYVSLSENVTQAATWLLHVWRMSQRLYVHKGGQIG